MNSASRLLAIYDQLLKVGGGNDVAMIKRWAEVFALPHEGPRAEDDVATCLLAMRSEIDLARTTLLHRGVPEDLLHPGFARLRQYCSTTALNAGWNSYREEANRPETRLAWAWAAWVLQNEAEDDLPPEEFAALLQELNDVELALRSTEMTPYLRDFIQRQIDSIRAALKLYPIRGVKPIEEALRDIVGTCTFERATLTKEVEKSSEPTKGVMKRVGTFIEKAAKIADNLDKVRKAGEGMYSLATTVGPALLGWAQHLIK